MGVLASIGRWERREVSGVTITCVDCGMGMINCHTQSSQPISNGAARVFLMDMIVRGYMKEQVMQIGATLTFVGNLKLNIPESNGAVPARFQECAVLRSPSQLKGVGVIIICVYHKNRLFDFLGRQMGILEEKLASNGLWEVREVLGVIITCARSKSGILNLFMPGNGDCFI